MTSDGLTKDEAKRQFLIVLNKNTETIKFGSKKIKYKFFLDFQKEIRNIQKKLIDLYPGEVKWLMTNNWKAKDNIEGCLTNTLMTEIENDILKMAIEYLKSDNIIVDCPMFDGLMPRLESVKQPIEDIISELDNLTQSYGIKWSSKQHNTELKSRILSLSKSDKLQFSGDNIVEIANYVWENVFKERLVSCAGVLYFKTFDTNLYISEKNVIDSAIHIYISEQELYICKDDDYIPLINVYNNINNVVDHILKIAMNPKNSKPNFMDILFKKSENKLNFNNGVYDFKTKQFIADPTQIEGFFKIPYDFTFERNEKLIADLYKRVLDPMFAISDGIDKDGNIVPQSEEKKKVNRQMQRCILHRLARAVAGYYKDKNWFKLEGVRNSGKGILMMLLNSAIGPYMTQEDGRDFLLKKNSGTTDAAKENQWLFGKNLVRILMVQEFMIPEGGKSFINGTLIKSITSGCDKIKTRAHYGMPIEQQMQCTILFAANEYPDIKPTNALETCTVFGMNGKFVDIENNEPLIPGFINYKKDDSVKDFVEDLEVGLSFIHILLDMLDLPRDQILYPESISEENEEADDQLANTTPLDMLKTLFVFTNNSNDKMTNADIHEVLTNTNNVLGKKTLAVQLVAGGAIPVKLRGNRGYSGIRIRTIEDE